ncbi:L-glyceraldehyde 3-phosphate reductase [Arthrobacter sp. Hiyo6]|nr:L-glyceraldehyde 3-phosphate reductase [Arthrobacter sp. Hiyo6]
MQQRYVGNSGLRVSALSLGTMSWARETDEQDASALLRSFVEAGGTLIDTAASYAEGQAEAMLGAMLGDVVARSEVVISTKAGISTADGRRSVDASRSGMLSGLDASLARLGTDYVDIWFAHAWDPNVPLEETLSALEFAVRSGRAATRECPTSPAGRQPRRRPLRVSRWWPASPSTPCYGVSRNRKSFRPSKTPDSGSWPGRHWAVAC